MLYQLDSNKVGYIVGFPLIKNSYVICWEANANPAKLRNFAPSEVLGICTIETK